MTPTYPIKTARLRLRPFIETDFDDMFDFHSRPEVVEFLYWNVRSRAETEELLKKRITTTTLSKEGDALALAVVLPDQNKLVGDVTLVWRSEEHQQAEIGFVFNPDHHGQGYATEASEAMLALGFREFSFHRIYGRCDARNVGSYKLMERLGMRREAHFIQNEIFKGEWGDEFVYAMLQKEWAERVRDKRSSTNKI
ncbi:MAG: N-acetyltransferase [Chloroflexi bacterium]|nr:MAG: N-acetyltransferase [Chloroflexota bacterium]MBL1197036.1 N-acetyltransferase [Chloroflexota bacterium]NOH14331.1 GNAT family N-acetyltransferase [Chloroflexota bacterium]